MTVEEKGQKIGLSASSSPSRLIWVQFGEVAFSINCFTAPYCRIYNFDDWFKLTLSFGIKLILEDFEPLSAMLFSQHAHFTWSSWTFGPQHPLIWSRSNQTFRL